MKTCIALLIFVNLLCATGNAQSQASPPAAAVDNDEEPDVPVTKPDKSTVTTVAEQTAAAWNMLSAALSDTETKAEPVRIDAINALGALGDFPVAQGFLRTALKDQDRYVRLAAVAAMGSSKNAAFLPDLKHALDDAAPEVSFTAAVGLWKMNDKSGASILDAVLIGDRKANRGLVTAEKHEAGQDLHSPSKLAAIGAEQGAYALLGPFGFGLSALRRGKGQNGIHPRVLAATLLAEDKSPAAMKMFIDALDDPDPLVRAAAARELGAYHGSEVTDALGGAMYDLKPAVRFTAAAAYIRAANPAAESKDVPRRKTAKSEIHKHESALTQQ